MNGFAVELVKQRIRIDDSLDVFAVHGVGGILGTLGAAILASTALGGAGYAEGVTMGGQLGVQAEQRLHHQNDDQDDWNGRENSSDDE